MKTSRKPSPIIPTGKVKVFCFAFLSLLFMLTGCKSCINLTSTVEKVTATLDKAIGSLDAANANWQQILGSAINDLPKEVQSTVTNEVNNVLQRTVSAAGAEVRCDADFFRNRVKQALQRIKAQYLGQTLPPVEPQLCNVIPIAIDMELSADRRNKIEFYGYDFDQTTIQVILVEGTQNIDVSQYLDRPTHYHMTLNLGASGIHLTTLSKRIILRWNNTEISSIAIIQKQIPICQSKEYAFQPSTVSYMPPSTRGDKDFGGHGPNVFSGVTLKNNGSNLSAQIYMKAEETKSDWTTGEGTRNFVIYTAPSGWTIEAINGPTSASYSYTDQNHDPDAFPGSGPVRVFRFYGDTDGDDVGFYTRVEIDFNVIRVQLKETGDCISSNTYRMLELQNAISEPAKAHMLKFPAINFTEPVKFDTSRISR